MTNLKTFSFLHAYFTETMKVVVLFCGRVPWLYQYWTGGFMVLWFYVQEHPKAQLALVLVLKKTGNGLKSHPTTRRSRESNLRPLVYKI